MLGPRTIKCALSYCPWAPSSSSSRARSLSSSILPATSPRHAQAELAQSLVVLLVAFLCLLLLLLLLFIALLRLLFFFFFFIIFFRNLLA